MYYLIDNFSIWFNKKKQLKIGGEIGLHDEDFLKLNSGHPQQKNDIRKFKPSHI